MKLLKITSLSILVALSTACSVTPHTFVNKYEPVELPDLTNNPTNSVEGSAFLMTVGGDAKTCAGALVQLIPVLPKSEYEREYDSVRSHILSKSNVDPEFQKYKRDIRKLVKTTNCDVDGKFSFENVPTASYNVLTSVTWQVPNCSGSSCYLQTQGGNVSKSLSIPSSSDGKKYKIVISR